jgi:hypothetical protein
MILDDDVLGVQVNWLRKSGFPDPIFDILRLLGSSRNGRSPWVGGLRIVLCNPVFSLILIAYMEDRRPRF